MANVDAPFGLRPAFHLTGGVIRTREYNMASGLSKNLFTGDVVIRSTTTNRITAFDSQSDSTKIVGVFAGCRYTASDGTPVFSPKWVSGTTTLGSGEATALVYDDPFIVYEIQEDGAGGAAGVAAIGVSADLVLTAGSSTTGQSAFELDSSDAGTGLNLFILDYVRRPDNDPTLANAKFLVLLNEHSFRNAGVTSFTAV